MLKNWLRTLLGKAQVDLKSPEKSSLRARPPRVLLIPPHLVSVRMDEPAAPGPMEIANISAGGIGFRLSSLPHWPPLGTPLRGEITLVGVKYPLEAKLVHLSSTVAGCAFTYQTQKFHEAFQKFFDVELVASKLVEMNSELLKPEEDGQPRFFHRDGYELFLVEQQSPSGGVKVVRFHMSFLGNYFEANAGAPLRYGYIEEREARDKPSHKSSELIRYSSKIPPAMIEASRRFVLNIGDLPDLQKSEIIAMLNGPAT